METTLFELTPEQKDLLQSLSQETGKSITSLIAEELKGLEARMRPPSVLDKPNGSHGEDMRDPSVQADTEASKPIWEVFAATDDIPEKEWEKLPSDLSPQHDHYIYGTPKRQI